uniref:Uncharacterized protein n=1 Tax=Tetraselmis sp. GSL018 TaxID=582737 RepID=A0A061RZF7_9CHLO
MSASRERTFGMWPCKQRNFRHGYCRFSWADLEINFEKYDFDLLKSNGLVIRTVDGIQERFDQFAFSTKQDLTWLSIALGDSRVQLLVAATLVGIVIFAILFVLGCVVAVNWVRSTASNLRTAWDEAEEGEEDVIGSIWDYTRDIARGRFSEGRRDGSASLSEEPWEDPQDPPGGGEEDAGGGGRRRGWITWRGRSYEDLQPQAEEESVALGLGVTSMVFFFVFVWAITTDFFLVP